MEKISGRIAVIGDAASSPLWERDSALPAPHRIADLPVFIEGERVDTLYPREELAERILQAHQAHLTVSTSRPSPGALSRLLEETAVEGAQGIIFLTVSSRLSGLFHQLLRSAAEAPVPVLVVDSALLAGASAQLLCQLAGLARGGELDALAELPPGTVELEGEPLLGNPALLRVRQTVSAYLAAQKISVYLEDLGQVKRSGRAPAQVRFLPPQLGLKVLASMEAGAFQGVDMVRTPESALGVFAQGLGPGNPSILAETESALPPVVLAHTGPGARVFCRDMRGVLSLHS